MRSPVLESTAIGLAVLLGPRSALAQDDMTVEVSGSAAGGFASKTGESSRPRDVPDAAALFEGRPGLRVRRLAGASSFATLSIRGSASNQVAVSLAGVPLTGAADPSLDFATLPLWPGASARAHRSFAPAALGGGYLGGLVEIMPVQSGSAGEAHTDAYDALGSFGTYRMRLADVRPLGAWTLASGVSFSRSDNDFLYWDPRAGVDVRRRNADHAQLAGIVHARRDAGAWTILVTSLASTRGDGIAGPFDNPTFAPRLHRERQLLAIEARERDDAGRFLARAWTRREARSVDDPDREMGPSSGGSDRVLAAGVALGRSVRFGDLVLDARVDESIETSSGTRVEETPRRDRLSLGLALDGTFAFTKQVTLVAAGRADLRDDHGDDTSAGTREILPIAHVGVEASPVRWLAIAAHAGALARPPSFLELLGDGGSYRASPGLQSEHALAADVGVRAALGGHPRGELELVGFASSIRDLIVFTPVSLTKFAATNVGEARVLGAEALLSLREGPLRVLASYTRLATEDRTADPTTRGAPLPGRPGHDLTCDVSYTIGPATLRYGFDLVSSTTLDRAGTRELPTRMSHGVGARVQVGAASVLAQVDDLFDQRIASVTSETGMKAPLRYPISDFLGYPLPGRRFTLAVRWAL